MKPVETQLPSTSSTATSDKTIMSHSTKTIPQNQTRATKAPAELWQAIRTIISLQNQAPALVPTSQQQNLPLSFTQERLWFLDQLAPGSAAYNIPFALRLSGALNRGALEQSLREIRQRHQVLRTNFTTVENKPVQVIALADQNWSLTVQKLSELPETEREQEIRRLSVEAAQRPFDLSRDSLLRACLLELAPEDHLLLLTVHHIVFDGWSEGLLWRELALLYEAFCQGEASPLTELPVQYADFAVWQRQWLQGEFLEALLSYWQHQLGDNLGELQLPTDRPRPLVPTRRSASYKLILSGELTKGLKKLSRQEGATLFATLLAAFKVLLHHYTEQDDLFVCSPIANRNRKELKNLIGYFVNLLILRSDLSGNPSFQELLGRVRSSVSGAYAHQDLPVQQLVNRLDLVQTPLSQVMFVLQNTNRTAPSLSGLMVEELEVDNGTADFDLSLSVTERGHALIGVWKYNTDLFAPETISTMASHWQAVLEAVVANPNQHLADLLVLSNAERKQLRHNRRNYRVSPTTKISRTEEQENYVAPRTPLERRLIKIWEQILKVKPIGIKDNFFELGGESLVALRLFTQIEKVLGNNLPLTTLLQAPTVEELALVLSQTDEPISSSCSSLVPIQSHGSKPPLFLVHGAGLHVLIFKDLATYLGSEHPLYGLQPKGLNSQQTPLFRVEDMAAHYIQAIQTIQPQGPYYLGGFSFGGLVAFEMAQQLVRQGQEVGLVALLDTFSPNCFQQLSLQDRRLRHLNNTLRFGSKYAFKLMGKHVQRSWQRRINKLTIKYYGSLGKPLPYKLQEACVGGGIAHAETSYVPEVYPGKLTLFRASEAPQEWSFNARNKPSLDDWYNRDPQYGWGKLAGGGLEIVDVPGDHNLMLKEPNIEILATKLSSFF